jgi:quercetin dioxygenase-like cupin family protein
MQTEFESNPRVTAGVQKGNSGPGTARTQRAAVSPNTLAGEELGNACNRRGFLLMAAAVGLLVGPTAIRAHEGVETTGVPVPVKVNTRGVSAVIKYEAVVAGFLSDLNGRYKLRATEITIAPGGVVGDHNHLGPGIRQVTEGRMAYILPDGTVDYGPGDFFFEAGNVSHRVENRGEVPCTHILFEILPVVVSGPSLIPPRDAR